MFRLAPIAATVALLATLAVACADDDDRPSPTSTTSPPATATTTVTPSPTPPRTAPWPPPVSGPSVAYVAADGTVWLISADGASSVQLISDPIASGPFASSAASAVKWSTDGQMLAYTAGSWPGGPALGILTVLDLRTGEKRQLDDATWDFRWVPGDRYLAYTRSKEDGTETWLVDVAGGEKRKLGDDIGQPAWSHDGLRYVFTGRITEEYDPARRWASIALFYSEPGGTPERIVDFAGITSGYPFEDWSADDRLVAYWKYEHGGSALVGDICVWDTVTRTETCLREFSSDESPQSAAVKGRYFVHNYEIDPAAGTFRELFPRPGALLAWSPDAAKVAYVEGRPFGEGPRSLVVLDLESGEETVLHTSQASTGHPASPGYWGSWSPDGRYLQFIGLADTETEASLFVADIATARLAPVWEDFNLGNLGAVYSPDGGHLLIQWRRAAGREEIWIAGTDGSDLRKLADGEGVRGDPYGAGPWRPATPAAE
jgi:Tol biopolymer transport system component